MNTRITIWNEYRTEVEYPEVGAVYPGGIHNYIAGFLGDQEGFTVRTATMDQPEHGLTQDVLDETDVLIWISHMYNDDVSEQVIRRVQRKVLEGMGLVATHSAILSEPVLRLLGRDSMRDLRYRGDGDRERVWVVSPRHPIANGLGQYFVIPQEEMYGELLDIPEPDQLVFISWFPGGEVCRSGCCWQRGAGKIFYFRPGHEWYPTYKQKEVQLVLANACRWAAPVGEAFVNTVGPVPSMES